MPVENENKNAVSQEQIDGNVATGGQIIAMQKEITALQNENAKLKEENSIIEQLKSTNEKYAEVHYKQFEELHGSQPEAIQKYVSIEQYKDNPLKGIETLKGMIAFGNEYHEARTQKEPPSKDPLNSGTEKGSPTQVKNGDFSIGETVLKFIEHSKK